LDQEDVAFKILERSPPNPRGARHHRRRGCARAEDGDEPPKPKGPDLEKLLASDGRLETLVGLTLRLQKTKAEFLRLEVDAYDAFIVANSGVEPTLGDYGFGLDVDFLHAHFGLPF
jgi:hypothetical protein